MEEGTLVVKRLAALRDTGFACAEAPAAQRQHLSRSCRHSEGPPCLAGPIWSRAPRSPEVFSRLGHNVCKEGHHNAPRLLPSYRDVEIDARIVELRGGGHLASLRRAGAIKQLGG